MPYGPAPQPLRDEWEKVGAGNNQVDRLRIEGGWIYRHVPSHREPCMVFVPTQPGEAK